MTEKEIRRHINLHHYDPSLSSHREFKLDLFLYANAQGVTNISALDALYSAAYEIGHSNGYSEILIWFQDLLPICKAYEK